MTITQQVLDIQHVTKFYGPKLILNDVSLSVNRRDRIGLVGENGTGKTTLACIIMGTLAPDSGERRFPASSEIGYLPQEPVIEAGMTVQQFLERAIRRLDQLRSELNAMEEELAQPGLSPEQLEAVMDRYAEAQQAFAGAGGYDLDYRIEQVFAGLNLAHLDRARPVQTLSGGEQTRVMLASLLLGAPELLILDEPTNHLDHEALGWLENYLLEYSGAVLAISHDRRFLNRVVTQVCELSPIDRKLTVYPGSYDYYMAERERLRQKQIEAYETRQEEMRTLRRLIKSKTHNLPAPKAPTDGNKMSYDAHGARVEKSVSRDIRMAKKRLEVLEADPVARPVLRWQINPDFDAAALVSRDVIRLIDVSKSYGERTLFAEATATITNGQRVVLQGPNGVGKTTLIRLILGLDQPDSGTIRIAGGAQIGYLDQQQETLNPAQTVLEAFRQGLAGTEGELRASLHRYGLFAEDQVFQKIESLSSGQRRKLQIARLIATRRNLLILDEPTNHLDLESVEQFEQALCEFQGTVLAISHDRTFAERVATVIWTIHDRRLIVEA